MTSVMPAWKQALIEKKRKREQEEKAKIQVEEDRAASLPEWKKTLLARKKGLLHGADTNGLDEQANIIANNNVSGYDKPGQKRNSFTSNSTERQLESNLSKSPPNVIIIPKVRSQSGSQGRQHSFVASSSASQSDQQKENKQVNQKLSKNDQEKINNQGIVPEDEENNSKVCYEHIKTPSELRKLFGVVSRDVVSFSSTSTESKKIQNQQSALAYKDVSTKPQRSSITRDYEQSRMPSVNSHAQTYSRESIRESEVELHKSHTPANSEENNVVIISIDNDTANSFHSEHDNRAQIVKDDEIPADLHVNVIRTKFGPSGNFRLQKSSSSDNLLNSKQPMSPRGKPPPLNKRWSADVSGILSPTRSTSEDEDTYDLLHNDHQRKRLRSKSMGDVRIPLDYQYQDMEPVVNLKHRASVSSGIERRLQVLLHNLAVADGKQDDYEEVGDVENMDIHLNENFPGKDHLQDDYRKNTSSGVSSGKQIDEDDLPPKIRKASWYNSEENSKDTRFIFTEQDYDLNKIPALESTSSFSSSGHDFNKSFVAQEKKGAKHYDFGRSEVATTDKRKQISNLKTGVQFKESVPQKAISMNGKIFDESEDDEPDKNEKPPKGSVYKLSSIFGASISKGNKKTKAKTNNVDVTSKTAREQLLNQENMSKTGKKNSQKRIFPWSKKPKKPEPVKEVKGEQNKQFDGVSSLRPVHQEVVEQKITGNMTLVINSSAGSYEAKSRPKPPKLNFANQPHAMGYSNSLSDQNSQVKVKNENKGVEKPEDMMVTAIDVPSPSIPNDVEVSAIDMPETPSPTPVSVIDIPESPEHDVKVSVIDMPDDEGDSDDSDSSSSGMSGSYDINPAMESIGEEEEEEEEEEDIDNVPVSYVGDSTYMKVPEVIFESKVENIKSCMSSPLRSRKRKANVGFSTSNLVKVHDYPSEACMQYHYDQHSKENGGKTLDQYRPALLQGFELNVREREKEKEVKEKKDKSIIKHKVLESTDNTEISVPPTITYLDKGEAFTSSSSSGALLF